MDLNDDVVDRCLRLGPLHQRHPSRSRSLIRHNNSLHVGSLLDHRSLCRKSLSDGTPWQWLVSESEGTTAQPHFHRCSSPGRALTDDSLAPTTFALAPAGAAPLISATARPRGF